MTDEPKNQQQPSEDATQEDRGAVKDPQSEPVVNPNPESQEDDGEDEEEQ